MTGLKGGGFRITINGTRNGPAFEIDCAVSVNNEILFFRGGYNFLKYFGSDNKSGESDELSVKLEMVKILKDFRLT